MRPNEIAHSQVIPYLAGLQQETVQCCITSPPYWGLRAYDGEQDTIWGGNPECDHKWVPALVPNTKNAQQGNDEASKHPSLAADQANGATPGAQCTQCTAWAGSLGLEPTPSMFIDHLVQVFKAVRRVLRPDGVAFINMGDSYARGTASQTLEGVREKNLCLIPQRLIIALQDDGWYIRDQIIWHKPSTMPSSVADRCTPTYEIIIMATKGPHYYWDTFSMLECAVTPAEDGQHNGLRRMRNVWTINTAKSRWRYCTSCQTYYEGIGGLIINGKSNGKQAMLIDPLTGGPKAQQAGFNERYSGATQIDYACPCGADAWVQHFAAYPSALPERMIKLATSDKGACAECRAPYKRLTDKLGPGWSGPKNTHTKEYRMGGARLGAGNGDIYPSESVYAAPEATIGWEPTCGHKNAKTVPCVVLDPFMGSGTTALVAEQLGRQWQGCDASHTYTDIITARIEKQRLTQPKGRQIGLFEHSLNTP